MTPLLWRPAGDRALLAEVAGPDEAEALYAAARAADVPATDVVPAAATVLFSGVEDLAALRAAVDRLEVSTHDRSGPLREVPVRYDGEDLHDVAERCGLTVAEVVRRHAAAEYRVAFCGFAPGFAYCTGLPPELRLPRRETPRVRVPRGSVGIAGEFTGVYPTASPGGWRLLGRTELALWDSEADPPALLSPGTRVRFVAQR